MGKVIELGQRLGSQPYREFSADTSFIPPDNIVEFRKPQNLLTPDIFLEGSIFPPTGKAALHEFPFPNGRFIVVQIKSPYSKTATEAIDGLLKSEKPAIAILDKSLEATPEYEYASRLSRKFDIVEPNVILHPAQEEIAERAGIDPQEALEAVLRLEYQHFLKRYNKQLDHLEIESAILEHFVMQHGLDDDDLRTLDYSARIENSEEHLQLKRIISRLFSQVYESAQKRLQNLHPQGTIVVLARNNNVRIFSAHSSSAS